MRKGIVWFRQDLRLADNEAIVKAIESVDEIIYVYVFDQKQWDGLISKDIPKIGPFRKRFLFESVKILKNEIEARGGHLHIQFGNPDEIIFNLANKFKTSWVFCNRERMKEEVQIQDHLEESLWTIGQELRYSRGKMLFHTADLPFPVTHTSDQFATFRKEIEKFTPVRPPLEVPDNLKSSAGLFPDIWPEELISQNGESHFHGGCNEGQKRLQHFVWDLKCNKDEEVDENGLIGLSHSSRFSPWLALGCLSPKQIYVELKKFETENGKSECASELTEDLLWRDFFRLMGKKHSNKIFLESGYATHPRRAGERNEEKFNLWAQGRTRVPVVDACMRELNKTGWLSYLGRKIVGSYLIYDLNVLWTMGAEYFESALIDYDPCSNYGNWAYIAGVGSSTKSDGHLNASTLAKRFDPQGDYVKKWSLRGVT